MLNVSNSVLYLLVVLVAASMRAVETHPLSRRVGSVGSSVRAKPPNLPRFPLVSTLRNSSFLPVPGGLLNSLTASGVSDTVTFVHFS